MHGSAVWAAHAIRAYPVLGICTTLALLAGLMIFLKALNARYGLHAELPRKVLHIGIGLVTVSFPWVFAETWPVFVLAGASCVLMFLVKTPGPLRGLMGGVVDSVDRKTYGDIYFPMGVAALFWLSQRAGAADARLLFVIPMLLLTLGDAMAALVGVRFGRHKLTTGDGLKSVEGSLACFVAAFACTLVPLLLMARMGSAQALTIAVIVGILATAIEAVSWSGLDNLFLPLGGYLILRTHVHFGLRPLVAHLCAIIALFTFAILWRRRATLDDSAVLGAALYGYCAWCIGGLEWLYAPAVLFLAYPLLQPRTAREVGRVHSASVVLCTGAAGLVWLSLSVARSTQNLVHAYNVAFAAQMAMMGLARLRHRLPDASGALLLALSVSVSWLLLSLPAQLAAAALERMPVTVVLARLVAALVGVAVAAVLFDRARRDRRDHPCDAAMWRLQAVLGAVGSVVGMAPLLWGA